MYTSAGLWLDDVVDFEDHLDHLCSQLELALLGKESLEDLLFFHVAVSGRHAVDAEERLVAVCLFSLGVGQRFQGIEA